MKKNHANFWVGLSVIFAAAVYSIVLFLLKTEMDISAWVLYGATIISFILLAVQLTGISIGNSAVVMDTTLRIVTFAYFGIQLVVGGIILMCVNGLPLTPVLVFEILLLAVYMIIVFAMYSAQSRNESQERQDRRAARSLQLMENDLRGIADEASDPEVKKSLQKLAESVHFSDPASLPGLGGVEDKIIQNIAALRTDLTDETADIPARIDTIQRLLDERDRTAALLKR